MKEQYNPNVKSDKSDESQRNCRKFEGFPSMTAETIKASAPTGSEAEGFKQIVAKYMQRENIKILCGLIELL
jgi:hypothetical protein